MKIVCRDLVKKGFTKEIGKGCTSTTEYVNAPLIAIDAGDIGLLRADHIRVEGVWFVRVPESEQKRLVIKFDSRA